MIVPDPEMPGGERAKVLDFGIAKLHAPLPDGAAADGEEADGALRTTTGAPAPRRHVPEQCRGAGAVDHKSDVYSLGVMLYQFAAGKRPFRAQGMGEVDGGAPVQRAALPPCGGPRQPRGAGDPGAAHAVQGTHPAPHHA